VTEIELLEKYEPVLRFAKSERFFPMAVEPYVERCSIFASGPQAVLELFAHHREPLLTRIGKLENEQFYLRFINKPLNDSDAWVWWAALSVLGMGIAWFLMGVVGVEVILPVSFLVALLIFMLASPIRLRIIPAVLATLLFVALESTPIWFFLHHSKYVSIAVEYLILLPIYLIVLFYLAVRTMKFVLDHVIPEGPGMVMDMLSQATEKIAREAYFEYAKILEGNSQPVYYGRVLHETDGESNCWTILQYHFFYAFNDWRLAANGINHHEGDWEMMAVYLKNDQPHAVLFSQHGAGAMELWQNVRRMKDTAGNETTHPIVYVALGSHANYSKPEVIRMYHLVNKRFVQRFLYWTDGLIRFLFLLFNPSQRERQIALRELTTHPATALTEETFASMRDEKDHYLVSLPMEIATGDGFRVGVDGDHQHEEVGKSTSYLKRIMSDRAVKHPGSGDWNQVLFSDETTWVEYKGLWGVKSLLADESGPPGPKWRRPDKFFMVYPRKRWESPLEWLRELEKK
jgi:hypothetical protein